MHRDPVQIVRTIRARCRTITDVSDELTFARERPDELVIRHAVARIVRRSRRSRGEGLVEQLERDLHFLIAKHGSRVEYFPNTVSMPFLKSAEFHLHRITVTPG